MQINVPNHVILDNLYINVAMGRELLDSILGQYGKDGWNAYIRRLRMHNIWAMYSTPEPNEDDEHCMPVCIEIKFSDTSFANQDLSGLDLSIPECQRCNFNGADLSNTSLGTTTRSVFEGARLTGATFTADISGADFTLASVEGTSFKDAWYDRKVPPVGLPDAILESVHRYPEHWDIDEEEPEDKTRTPLDVKRVDLCSFWGGLA
jgi:hypothetical protein